MNDKIKKLQQKLNEKGLDGAIILDGGSDLERPNTIYYSGFLGTTSVIIITADKAIFATDFRYIEYATDVCGSDFEIDKASVGIKYITEKIKELGIKKIGFEESKVPFSMYSQWNEKLPDVNFAGIQTDIDRQRMIKTPDELEKIQRAVDIGDGAFSHILGIIRPGITEIDIAAELEYFMRKEGAIKPSFDTIAVSGTKTSMPHGKPDGKIIEAGDPITMDFGCVVDGYCSDMTRTIFAGQPKEELKKIYNLVLKAQEECQAKAYAGKTGMEIDAISRDIIYGAGYEGCYDHGLGHSVGLDIHESPRFSTKETTVMENGMVMTVEPGIYVAGLGGVRIENMIVINDENPINMTNSTKEMIIL